MGECLQGPCMGSVGNGGGGGDGSNKEVEETCTNVCLRIIVCVLHNQL